MLFRSDVVLYEEGLDDKTVTEAVREISHCDTLIIAGTSLTVYPAAGMVRYFQGDNLVPFLPFSDEFPENAPAPAPNVTSTSGRIIVPSSNFTASPTTVFVVKKPSSPLNSDCTVELKPLSAIIIPPYIVILFSK